MLSCRPIVGKVGSGGASAGGDGGGAVVCVRGKGRQLMGIGRSFGHGDAGQVGGLGGVAAAGTWAVAALSGVHLQSVWRHCGRRG